jgi:nicotinate-nucleotide adenylyltransferase
MNVAILGGAFNPPHWGHLSLARQILDFLPIDFVWLMPTYCYNPSFRKPMISFNHRYQMTRRLEGPKIKVSDFEKNMTGVSYTYSVLKALTAAFPKLNFSFILGSDQLTDFDRWYDYRNLLKEYQIYVFPREAEKLTLFPGMKLIRSPLLKTSSLSSSLVRNMVGQKKSLQTLVPPEVATYIRIQNLYQSSPENKQP